MDTSNLYDTLFEYMKKHVYRYSDTPITLASGKTSHHYFNCKEISMHPQRLQLLARYFVEKLIPLRIVSTPEAIGGLTLGADPISYAISLEFSRQDKLVYPLIVRKETKDHGIKKLIEGALSSVKTCLVVDDVITTGGSTIKAVHALRDNGITVKQGICILDREEGGKEALQEIGVEMYSVFQKSNFI
ncbi:MAG: orotate phosphoribosyltransferase [Leptospiraceae bacterium]|nr:orotate phosphoribosyltransferase [Leptospiraceae bacterium]